MLGLTDRDLKQTRFYQEVFAEGEQQGELKGRHEGRQEGRQEGEAAVILRLLQRRCGVLAPESKARITALRLEQLEPLAEAVLAFTGLPDLEQWLTDHAKT